MTADKRVMMRGAIKAASAQAPVWEMEQRQVQVRVRM